MGAASCSHGQDVLVVWLPQLTAVSSPLFTAGARVCNVTTPRNLLGAASQGQLLTRLHAFNTRPLVRSVYRQSRRAAPAQKNCSTVFAGLLQSRQLLLVLLLRCGWCCAARHRLRNFPCM